MTDVTATARAMAVVLARAEHTLGLSEVSALGIKERCHRVLLAAQRGGLDQRTYRAVWFVHSRIRRG